MGGLWRSLLAGVVISLYTSTVTGELSIKQGRVTFTNGIHVVVYDVEGVAVLNLSDTTINHYFDCVDSIGSSDNLVWLRGGENVRFPLDPRSNNILRMNMSPENGMGVGSSDTGVYTCNNTQRGESVSINITGGVLAINPLNSNPVVRLGDTITLSVYVVGIPPVRAEEIVWYKISTSNRLTEGGRLSFTNDARTLTIQNVEIGDEGMYHISIVRGAESATATINLHITTLLVVSSPSSNTVLEHNRITFHCEFSGTPLPNIEWMKEGGDLPVMSRTKITTSPNGTTMVYSVFVIEEVMYSDQGRYRCVATNIQGVSKNSLYGVLTVIPKLLLEVTLNNTNVQYQNGIIPASIGTRVEIRCKGSGTLTWESSSGSNIPVDTPGTTATNTYQHYDSTTFQLTLYIQSFAFDDVATYTCRSDLTSSDNSNLTEYVFITDSDPALYIAERVIFTTMGSTAQITAAIYSSNPNILTIKWYLANTLIDIDSNPRYSVTQNESFFYTLNVMNVDESVLGWYRIIVTGGGRNETGSVQLSYLYPPTSTISPPSYSVSEGERVQFQCLANGTNPHTTWTLEGGVPLPSGVVQDGNNLVIDSASRNLTGHYDCTVNNSVGSVKSTATLIVYYPPMARITHEMFGHSSIGGVLRVIAEEGDPSPTFFCSSDGLPIPVITWSGQNGGVELPNDVILRVEQTTSNLVWNRRLEYTDSGFYECTAQNSQRISVARLELLVQKSPRIETISPTYPVTSSSSVDFLVPVGYTGTILTCIASGWPTPTIRWLRDGQLLNGNIYSDSTSLASSAIVSSRLRGNRAFSDSDIGNYTCIVQANDTDAFHSTDVYLNLSTSTPDMRCSVESTQIFFHIRVLNTDCVTWVGDLKEHISDSFSEEMVNVVVEECSECSIMTDNIVISNSPTCSNQVEGAALFRGSITTSEVSLTENIFCALKRWQETEPLIAINNQLYQVDKRCNLESDSLTSSECSGYSTRTDKSNTIIYIAIGGGVGVAILVILLVVISCCFYKKGKSRSQKIFHRRNNNSDYERTIHNRSDSILRYTAQINPENTCQETPVYSTLNTALVDPDSKLDFEMSLLRKNSKTQVFNVVEDTSDGKIKNGSSQSSKDGGDYEDVVDIPHPNSTCEQIARKYGPNEYPSHESPSLKLNNHEVLPTRMGHMRGFPQGEPFRRHMSTVETRWKDPNTDYSVLERDGRARQHSLVSHGNRRRNQSVPSMMMNRPTGAPPLIHPHTEKHVNTSSSPTDSLTFCLTMKNHRTHTPTNSEPPHSYNNMPLGSPSSPVSGSSMIENEAYGGVNTPSQVMANFEAVRHQGKEGLHEQPRSSDIYPQTDMGMRPSTGNLSRQADMRMIPGIENHSRQADMRMRASIENHSRRADVKPTIEPYSQVSNYEIECRGEQEMNPDRVPRFSFSQKSAMPYLEAVPSIENLTSANQNSHIRTIRV